MSGAMRTLLRWKGPGIVEYPVPATGRMAPFPTTMEEGTEEDGDRVTIPELEAICEEAPESNTQSEVLEGEMRETVLTRWRASPASMATKQEQVPDEAPGTAGLVLEMVSRRPVTRQPSEPAVAPVQGEVAVHANRRGWSRATCGWTRSTDCGRTATAGPGEPPGGAPWGPPWPHPPRRRRARL
jgi:hypothetical protein